MEPLAVECLACRLVVSPVAERVVRIRARAQADLTPFPAWHLVFVLVENVHVPAGHGPAHRSLAHLQPRVVRDEWIRLGEAVVVEHRHPILVAEPADRLRVQRLAGGADAAKCARVPPARVVDRHHRAHRRRRREDVRDVMA